MHVLVCIFTVPLSIWIVVSAVRACPCFRCNKLSSGTPHVSSSSQARAPSAGVGGQGAGDKVRARRRRQRTVYLRPDRRPRMPDRNGQHFPLPPICHPFHVHPIHRLHGGWLGVRGGHTLPRRLTYLSVDPRIKTSTSSGLARYRAGAENKGTGRRWASSPNGTSTSAAARPSHGGRNGTLNRGSRAIDSHMTARRAPAPSVRPWMSSRRSEAVRVCYSPSRTR